MGIKRVLATVLAATMIFGSVAVSADVTSPTSYNAKSAVETDGTEVTAITRTADDKGAVVLSKTQDGKAITSVAASAFKDKKNTTVTVKSKKRVTFKAKALKGSAVKTIKVKNNKSIKLAKNALTGGQKKVTIYFTKKAAVKNFKFAKSKGVKVTINATKAVKKSAAYKALKAKAKKLGITVK